MKGKTTYIILKNYLHLRAVVILRIFVLILSGLYLFPYTACAQEESSYNEIYVSLDVRGIGITEIPGIINNNNAYLSFTDVFDYLKIKNDPSLKLDSVTGFFINQDSTFIIDKTHNLIRYKDKQYELDPNDLIKTESGLYLKTEYFGLVFGLDCKFNFRNLSVTLTTNKELPLMRDLRLDEMRHNVNHLNGMVKADTTVQAAHPFFHLGMADWSVISTQQTSQPNDTRFGLSLGSALAGGEANAALNISSTEPFDQRLQYYMWRHVNNDNSVLRQVLAGTIYTQSISSIYAPVVGLQFTNTPTTFRRSFGTYTLSNTTHPGWMVELYVNNVLVDYKKADAAGVYTFEVPLVYGNSIVKLRFYGPWGETYTREQNISIPFNFLPSHEFEYTVSGGIVEDGHNSQFSRVNLNYGLSKRITVSSGVEYLSSVTSGTTMPFLNTSIRLATGLLLNGDYTYGVRSRGLLSYRTPSDMQFDLNYINYNEGQTAINNNYLDERKAIMTIPIRGNNFSMFSRITLDQVTLPETKYSTAEWMLSGSVFGAGINMSTFASFLYQNSPYVYTNLSIAFRLPKELVFTPQVQYEYDDNQFISLKGLIEKRVFKKGFLNFSYEQNFKSNIENITFGFRYELPYAQVSFNTVYNNLNTSFVESARGSLMYDTKTNYLNVNNRISVGKGGILLVPYLDLNCDGKRDPDEPKALGLKFRINGGRIENVMRDSTIRILDLEPYLNYLIELDPNSFDNIAWQMQKKAISIAIAANQFTEVDIPIAVVGEASGLVYMRSERGDREQGRIIVNLYNKDSSQIARTLSDAGGFFNFTNLAPGAYFVMPDTSQLSKLHLISSPLLLPFTIYKNKDGDVIDGLKFVLKNYPETVPVLHNDKTDTIHKGDNIHAEQRKQAHKTKVITKNNSTHPIKQLKQKPAVSQNHSKTSTNAVLDKPIEKHASNIKPVTHTANPKHKTTPIKHPIKTHAVIQHKQALKTHKAVAIHKKAQTKHPLRANNRVPQQHLVKHASNNRHALQHSKAVKTNTAEHFVTHISNSKRTAIHRHHYKHKHLYKNKQVKLRYNVKPNTARNPVINNTGDTIKDKKDIKTPSATKPYSPKKLFQWLHNTLHKPTNSFSSHFR